MSIKSCNRFGGKSGSPIILPVMISLCGIAFGSLSSNIVTPPIPVPKYLGSSGSLVGGKIGGGVSLSTSLGMRITYAWRNNL
jgi:hypothetical protein